MPYRMQRVDQLVEFASNPRTHSKEQIELLAGLIKEYGFTNPILVDGERGIIAGHGRLMAAKQLGWAMVPTLELSHLTADQRRAYVIADNASAERAGWDRDLLDFHLEELRLADFDLSLTGLTDLRLGQYGQGEGAGEADEAPGLALPSISRPGDVWLLGASRLECGDGDLTGIDGALLHWCELTGRQATLEDGRTFDQAKTERA